MILREMSLEELAALRRDQMGLDFPPEELKPFAAMRALYDNGVYHPVGAFDSGGALLGYALLWDAPGTKYVLIDYLGVPAARRNGGLGGTILRMLGDRFSDYDGIIVESEALDGGPEDGLRRRRMDFYRRAGFRFLGYDCVLFGVHYAVCLLSPNGKGTEEEALAAHIALYRSQFTPRAYGAFIQIPRDPDHPLAPPESWADLKTLPGLGEGSDESC